MLEKRYAVTAELHDASETAVGREVRKLEGVCALEDLQEPDNVRVRREATERLDFSKVIDLWGRGRVSVGDEGVEEGTAARVKEN